MKMPQELKMKWVEALRSGKYKQATGTLYDPQTKGFCCLGVLEHIALAGDVEIDPVGKTSLGNPKYLGTPTKEFWDSVGAANDVGSLCHVAHCGTISTLMELNDGNADDYDESDEDYIAPLSFTEIADVIERDIEGV